MQIIDFNNEFYPELLRKISDPPKKIYVLGNVSNLNSNSIAIIGSRRCTEYGRKNGINFGYNLAKEDFTIVSGMAVRYRRISTHWCIKSKRENNCCFRRRF